MMSRLPHALRNHLHFIIIMPLLIIVMTWPTFERVFDTDRVWIHATHTDNWTKFWDALHVQRVLAGQDDYFFTTMMFYPRGLPLAFYQISLPHAIVFGALQEVMPSTNAYILCFLFMILFNACSTYLFVLHFIKDRWIALFGALIVGFSPFCLGSTTLPDLMMIGTLPLAMYCFHRAIVEERWTFAALAGVLTGITAFIGLFAFACLLLTLAFYGSYFALSRWQSIAFWRRILLLVVVLGSISAFRIYPIVTNKDVFDAGMQKYEGREHGHDVSEFLIYRRNTILTPLLSHVLYAAPLYGSALGYLGYVNLFLIAIALRGKRNRRRLIPWMAMLALFGTLRLGDSLTVNGSQYTNIKLPKHYLDQLFPLFFEPFSHPEYFQIGVLLPLALLSCFGLAKLLEFKALKSRIIIVLSCCLLLAVEYYRPFPGRTVEPQATKFIEWLQTEDHSAIKLINLPITRETGGYERHYLYLQSIGGYPQVGGYVSRLPFDAYDYINSNHLLSAWGIGDTVNCLPSNRHDIIAALDELNADGFTHIVVHLNFAYDLGSLEFPGVPARFENEYAAVYRLEDVYDTCSYTARALKTAPTQIRSLALSPSIRPEPEVLLISMHPSARIDDKVFPFLASTLSDWQGLVHLYLEGNQVQVQNADERYSTTENIVADSQILLLLWDPRLMESAPPENSHPWLSSNFRPCSRIGETDNAIIAYYVNSDFPCELFNAETALQVQYDNGLKLSNLIYTIDNGFLDVSFWWKSRPRDTHAFSVQFFDANGNRAYGQDFVIGHEPLARHRVDLSSLVTGEYVANLILYNYDTGVSVPGTVTSSQTRFDRELEITRIAVE